LIDIIYFEKLIVYWLAFEKKSKWIIFFSYGFLFAFLFWYEIISRKLISIENLLDD